MALIEQWAIYVLPDGERVYTTQSRTDGQWKFCALDDQPRLLEDERQRGRLL